MNFAYNRDIVIMLTLLTTDHNLQSCMIFHVSQQALSVLSVFFTHLHTHMYLVTYRYTDTGPPPTHIHARAHTHTHTYAQTQLVVNTYI